MGKTLLARLCADLLSRSNGGVMVFDTDFPAGTLARRFSGHSDVISFKTIRDQVRLFDTIINEPERNYVIDLQPEYLDQFFMMSRDASFEANALAAGIGTGVYYLQGPATEQRSPYNRIRSRLRNASLTTVVRSPKAKHTSTPLPTRYVRPGPASRKAYLPHLSSLAAEFAERPDFQFSWDFKGNSVRPPAEVRLELLIFMDNLREWSAPTGWTETLAL